MSEHLTLEHLRAWRGGKLPPNDVVAVARHLAACPGCAAQATADLSVPASVRAIHVQIEGDDLHPDLDTELFTYADGTLPPERRAAIDAHLAGCARCREDVGDLLPLAGRRSPALPRWALIAAATLAAVVVTSTLVLFDREDPAPVAPPAVITAQPAPPTDTAPVPQPAPETPSYSRTEWGELVRGARAGRPLPMPDVLKKLRRASDILRGPSSPRDTPLAPVGVVLETQLPTFTWPAPEGARSTVSLFAGTQEVVRSRRLSTTSWTPPRALARGVTYTWEVEVEVDGDPKILPAPPAPPARFHIVDEATLADLDAAARAHPDDHLLLGLLYARAGLDDRARAELGRVDNPQDVVVARRILRQLEAWRSR